MAYANPADAAAYEKKRSELRKLNQWPSYLDFKERKKLEYEDRKARQVCVECEAPLDDDDGARCKGCHARNRETKRIYEHTRKGRATQRRVQRKYYRKRKKRDLCLQCGTPRHQWPPRVYKRNGSKPPKKKGKPLICPTCRTKANEAAQRYRERKRLGITSIRAERAKRDREKLRELREARKKKQREKQAAQLEAERQERREIKRYVPIDVLLERKRVRILRGLRGRGWLDPETLFDIMEIATHEEGPERSTYSQTLSRLATKTEFVERREVGRFGKLALYEYRLAPLGGIELARILGSKAA